MKMDPVKDLSGGVARQFIDFQKSFCGSESRREAGEQLGLKIRCSYDGYYIDGLAHAARQHSFAADVSGFTISGSLSAERAAHYFSLFKVQAAVAALEQYAGCFGKKWYDLKLSPDENSFNHDAFRKVLKDTSAKKIVKSLIDPLSVRWREYLDGSDAEIIGVAVALRHAFAHGEIWGAKEMEPYGGEIAKLVLDAVTRDANSRVESSGGS